MATNTNRTDSTFDPSKNESENHMRAKQKLAFLCGKLAQVEAEIEAAVFTEYKTYYCDVLVKFKVFGAEIKLDLEVEDHDHSKHDYDDARNKAKELERYFIRTIWFKSKDILKLDYPNLMAEILYSMIDGNQSDPRFNI